MIFLEGNETPRNIFRKELGTDFDELALELYRYYTCEL